MSRLLSTVVLLFVTIAAFGQGGSDRYVFGFSGGSGASILSLTTPSGVQNINWTDRGWYRQDGLHNPANDNYIAGLCCFGGELVHRDWFVFDLPGGDPVLGASLTVFMPSDGYFSIFAAETYVLRDVTTDLGQLVAGTGGLTSFNDLADGNVYGIRTITPATEGTDITIPLNAAAIAAINAAGSGLFAMGGSLSAVALDQGTIPGDPLLPTPGVPFVFSDPPPRRWFDPPFASAFEYEISGGFFTQVGLDLAFPGASVDVLVGTTPDGTFYVNPDAGAGIGGDATPDFLFDFTTGDVTKFRVTGIGPVDLDDDGFPGIDPDAFPTFLDFSSGGTATITMTPIVDDEAIVPEPGTYLFLGTGLAVLAVLRRRSRRRN